MLLLTTIDEWEEICIVPVDEEISVAVGSADYQSLLISIGMQPPSDMVRKKHSHALRGYIYNHMLKGNHVVYW